LVAKVGTARVFVIRQKDGSVSAFYNVCKHRGGPLVMEECGSGTMLQCKYHGWTYRLDGSLRGVPRFDRTELFDKKDFGLTPLEVSEWQGLLFVRASAGGPGLDECLEGIKDRISPMSIREMAFHGSVSYDVACNWKVYVDNYLEGYHLPLVHPELCNALDYSGYVTEVYRYHSLQCSPMLSSSHYANPVQEGESAFYYFVYPNFMMNILPGRMQTNLVLPVAPGKCRVVFDYYYPQSEIESDAGSFHARVAADYDFSDRVQQEDIEICEHVQHGLESPAYDRGRFSAETEAGVHHFQSLVKESYRSFVNRSELE
jgi:choline monooxygenase